MLHFGEVVVEGTRMAPRASSGAMDTLSSEPTATTPLAIDVIRHSLKELGILNAVPDARTIYNDKFVPVKF